MNKNILYNGFSLGLGTLFITSILELSNLKTINNLIDYHGKTYYLKAWNYTIINSCLYGPITYCAISYKFVDYSSHNIFINLLNIQSILIIHSIGYWGAHNLMHTKYLWNIHKFHHTFSRYVTPAIAMAVTPSEYFLAYMFPFILASYIIYPTTFELTCSASIVSICNLIIHCPSLNWTSKYYPNWLVSPNKHLIHHAYKNNKHIAASTFDLDYIFIDYK